MPLCGAVLSGVAFAVGMSLTVGGVFPAQAATVTALTGATKSAPHGTAYVQMDDKERVVAGGSLRVGSGKSGRSLTVIEAFGQRALVAVPKRTRLKVGQRLQILDATPNKRPAPSPKVWDRDGRDWAEEERPDVAPRLESDDWRVVRVRPRELVKWSGQRGGKRSTERTRGDVQLATVLVKRTGITSDPLLQAQLSSRLFVPRVFGGLVRYRHDVSVYFDTIGGGQGGERARRPLRIRQLEVGTAPYRSRPWSVRGGRIVVPDGSGWQAVDGAAASMRLGDAWSVRAFGGFGPDIVSSNVQLDVQRFGAAVGYDQDTGSSVISAATGYSGTLYGGLLDRQLWGARAYIKRPAGTVRADVDLAFGGASLTDTGAAGLNPKGSGEAANTGQTGVRLHRAWLGVTSDSTQPAVARLRYSYYATQAWRELAMAVATDALLPSARHNAVLSVDWRDVNGPWVSPMLFGGYASGEDRWDGARAGGGVSAGWTGDTWSASLGVSGQRGFEQTVRVGEFDSVQRNGQIDRLSGFLGGRWRWSRRLGLGARLSANQTTIHLVDATATRARVRLLADWLAPPWTFAASVGVDRALDMPSYYTQDRVDWLDATLLVRRSLP